MTAPNKKTENRIKWLKSLVASHGGTAQFVRNLARPGAERTPTESYINQLIGGHKKSFGEKSAANIALLAGLSENAFDLPYIDNEQLTTDSVSQSAITFGDRLFGPDPGYIAFGLLDVRASAGNGSQQVDFPEVVRNVNVLESWAKANLPVDLSNIKVISARGTSMQGSIENGDVLFVDSSVKAYDGDGIYVIARGNDVQVKRLQKLNGDVLAVLSDNRAYESERLVGAEANAVVICGRVLAAWSIKRFW